MATGKEGGHEYSMQGSWYPEALIGREGPNILPKRQGRASQVQEVQIRQNEHRLILGPWGSLSKLIGSSGCGR